jgi:hypothetical protein
VLLFEEDFAGGLGGMTVFSRADPPNTGTESWHTTDKGGRYSPGAVLDRGVNRLAHPGAEPDFAILESGADPDPLEDEWLVTPEIDATGVTGVFLHFKSETVVSGSTQEVLASVDGGRTFQSPPLFSYRTGALVDLGEEPFYAERVLRVPGAEGEARVVLAFHWTGQGNEYWAIDDVRVTGTPAGGGQFPGDANADLRIDISDGIYLLNFLFVDRTLALPCEGAFNEGANGLILDWNGDSRVDLSDGVALFGWLFVAGGTPHVLDPDGGEPTCVLMPGCPSVCTP